MTNHLTTNMNLTDHSTRCTGALNGSITYQALNDLTVEDVLLRLRLRLDKIDRTFRANSEMDLDGCAHDVPCLLEALDALVTLTTAMDDGQY